MCVVMLIALLFGLAVPMLTTFATGFMQGWDATTIEQTVTPTGVVSSVGVLPKKGPMKWSHRIVNTKTGKEENVQLIQALVNAPELSRDDHRMFNIVMPALGFLSLAVCVLFLVFLVDIILSVNRNRIFDKRLEQRLAWCGWLLIIHYAESWAVTILNYMQNTALYEFEEYIVSIIEYPHTSLLLAGIGMLIIGQIFKIARQLKEEQELTI